MKKKSNAIMKGFASLVGVATLGLMSTTAGAADYLPSPKVTPENGRAVEQPGYVYLDWSLGDVEFDVDGLEYKVGSFKNIDRLDENGTPWITFKVDSNDYTEDWGNGGENNWFFGGSSIRLQYVQSEDGSESLSRVQISLGDMVPFFVTGEFNITVHEGLVKDKNGRISPEVNLQFFVMGAIGDPVWEPENNKVFTNEEMENGIKIKVTWPNVSVSEINSKAAIKPFIQANSSTGDVSEQIVINDLSIENGSLVLNIPSVGGTYSLSIPEGTVFLTDGGTRYINKEEGASYTFSTPTAELPDYVVSPAEGTVEGALTNVSVVWGDNNPLTIIGPEGVRILESSVTDDGVVKGLPGTLTANNGKLMYVLDEPITEPGTYNVTILASTVWVNVDGVNIPNEEIKVTYDVTGGSVELPELPAATSDPADGYIDSFINDHASVVWGYNPLQLVDASKIILTCDGKPAKDLMGSNIALDIALAAVIDGTGKEDNPNIDSGDGDGEDEEIANVLTIQFNDGDGYPTWLALAGEYVLTVPEGAVNVNVDGVWVSNQEVSFTWYVAYLNETTIVPTATYEDGLVRVNWNDTPIKVNEQPGYFDVFIDGVDGAIVYGKNAYVEGNDLVIDLTAYDLAAGDYTLSIAGHGLYLDKNGEFVVTGGSIEYNAYVSVKFTVEAPVLPELPAATSDPADGYIDSFINDHASVVWGYNPLQLVDASKITLTCDGKPAKDLMGGNIDLDIALAAVIDGTGKEDNPNIDSGDGDGENEEIANVLTIQFNDGDGYPTWLALAGEYVLTVPEGAVNVNVDGVWVPNQEVSFTWYVAYLNETTIVPTATYEDGLVRVNWNDTPIKVNEQPGYFDVFIDGVDGAIVYGKNAYVEGNDLVIDLTAYDLAAGDYTLSIAGHGLYLDKNGEFVVTGGSIEYNAYVSVKFTVEAPVLSHDHIDPTAAETQDGAINETANHLAIYTEDDSDANVHVEVPNDNYDTYYRITPDENGKSVRRVAEDGFVPALDNVVVIPAGRGTVEIYAEHRTNGTRTNTLTYTYEVGSSVETGVSFIGADANGVWRVYNLNGVNVLNTNNAADLDKLAKGLYIINGKKVVK